MTEGPSSRRSCPFQRLPEEERCFRQRVKGLRVLSFNIHKGYGISGRRCTLDRIHALLAGTGADLVFLQEVSSRETNHPATGVLMGQIERLADATWPHHAYGRNAVRGSLHHGNLIMSRLPILDWSNVDVSQHRLEQRGILVCDLDRGGTPLAPVHCFCVHFGLTDGWRRRQVDALCALVRARAADGGPVVIAGDFNDWREVLTPELERRLGVRDVFLEAGTLRRATYPAARPVFSLDRIYCRGLRVVDARVLPAESWATPSDHAPIVADLELAEAPA